MIILVSAIVLAIGIVLLVKAGHSDWKESAGIGLTVTGVFALVVFLALALLGPFGDRCKIAEFEATMTTIESARANPTISAIELAAIQQKVVELNQWLASAQYCRRNLWVGVFTSSEVMRLSPIR